ncbi:hypothetical protein ZWY2020_015561 [Hordeum vulgare]|nr:hypothetical protein ZWY2020_015561 [Hordeum vulgare]
MENPDAQAGADAGLPPPPPPPLDAGLGSDPAEVLPPPPPLLPGVAPYDAAQGADGSARPAEHASLNGTSGETAGYQAAENGAAADPMVPEQAYEDAMASAEEARLWGVVTADCLDFDAWTALIEETERIAESNIVKIRKVYDAFLAEFPLCFGYWKKYADHEGRLDGVNKVFEVYERAVLAVTYSVDIWCNYCQFAISTYNDPDVIRRLFDRGLAYVGTDYRSNTLWDEYIKYEESLQAWNHLAAVYTRILEHPIQQLDRYFNCLKELTATRSLSEILTAEETSMYCLTVENSAPVIDGEAHPNDVEKTAEPEVSSSTEAEDKAKYVSIREELYKKAKEYESKIISFEQAIRRPYFHVKPLDKPELENWHSYLDFIEREEDINKYLDEASFKQTEIHLFSARFKELNGDTDGARAEYQHLHSLLYPGLLEAIVKHANMEHRLVSLHQTKTALVSFFVFVQIFTDLISLQGDKESACLVYEKAIAAEKEKEQSQFLPMLLIQYSRFLYMICDLEKAREVSGGLHGLVNMTKPVLEAVIFLESIFQSEKRIDLLESLVEKFLTTEQTQGELASLNDKEELSSIYLEFLDTFGDIQLIKKATTRHTILFSRKRSILPSKKRRADDAVMSGRDKMAKTGDGTQPVMGTDPNAHNPAVWPATSEASAQQWGAAYAQQAAYPAYGAYDYSQQMPQSAPQAAAYGAYPPTYPAQAYRSRATHNLQRCPWQHQCPPQHRRRHLQQLTLSNLLWLPPPKLTMAAPPRTTDF